MNGTCKHTLKENDGTEDKFQINSIIEEELIHEFIRQCNYVSNLSLIRQLKPHAKKAADLCINMKVDPKTYISAHIRYADILKGQYNLTPPQLCCYNSKNYVTQFISLNGERNIADEFAAQCRIFADCLNAGWKEHMCLYNPSFDFYPWFRILMSAQPNKDIINKYGNQALQQLYNDRELVAYLKTIKSDTGNGLDFSRIPNLKL